MTQPQLLTTREVAEHLRVSERTVKRMLAAGLLTRVRIGRSVRIRRAEVDHLTASDA